MLERPAGRIDLADRQAGAVGHRPGDVGVGDVLVGLRPAATVQPVRLVVPAQHGAQPGRPVVGLEAGQLTLDQGFRRTARWGHFDRDAVADGGMQAAQDVAVRIMEGDREHVREMLVVIDDDLFQQPFHLMRQGRSVELNIGPDMERLGHRVSSRSSSRPRLRRGWGPGFECRVSAARGHRCH